MEEKVSRVIQKRLLVFKMMWSENLAKKTRHCVGNQFIVSIRRKVNPFMASLPMTNWPNWPYYKIITDWTFFMWNYFHFYFFQRRSGMISHFMCAVAVSSSTPGEHPKVFHSFCKVTFIHFCINSFLNRFILASPTNTLLQQQIHFLPLAIVKNTWSYGGTFVTKHN